MVAWETLGFLLVLSLADDHQMHGFFPQNCVFLSPHH